MSKTTTLNAMAINGEVAANIGSTLTTRNDRAALAIAASWTDFSVRAARAERHSVIVIKDGTCAEFGSVAQAFRTLGLPMSRHIALRQALVRNGVTQFDDVEFNLA